MKKILPDEIKKIEIGILDYVTLICKQYNLKYTLAYGTLLGAIRHKGFIPWDDDIDICMPREDYFNLLNILKEKNAIENNYFKVLIPNVDGYYNEFAKVIDTRTNVINDFSENCFDNGIWIDIFPLDGVSKLNFIKVKIINILYFIKTFSIFTELPTKYNKYIYWLPWKFCRIMGARCFLLNIMQKLSMSYSYKKARKVAYLLHHSTNRVYFDKSVLEDLIEVQFENKKYFAPRNYDFVLRKSYGDYMKLPPEDQRVGHPMEAYWRD